MVTVTVITKCILLVLLGLVTPVFAQLKWDQPQQKLSVKPGEKAVTANYRFTNNGTSPVTIVDVRPSCGCTTATLAKKTYAPGESGEIDAKLNFAGHTGHQEKWIYVTTNVAGTEPMLLTLAVDIPPDVTIVFLYNPFTGPIFEALIDKLLASVDAHPRPVRIIYHNPVEERILLGTGRITRVRLSRSLLGRRERHARISMYEVMPFSAG